MKISQIVIQRVCVVAMPLESLEEFGKLSTETSPVETDQSVWDSIVNGKNSVVLKDVTEVVDIADATSVCPTCLNPLSIKAIANIEAIPGESLTFTKIKNIEAVCIADPEHKISEEQIKILGENILDPSNS